MISAEEYLGGAGCHGYERATILGGAFLGYAKRLRISRGAVELATFWKEFAHSLFGKTPRLVLRARCRVAGGESYLLLASKQGDFLHLRGAELGADISITSIEWEWSGRGDDAPGVLLHAARVVNPPERSRRTVSALSTRRFEITVQKSDQEINAAVREPGH